MAGPGCDEFDPDASEEVDARDLVELKACIKVDCLMHIQFANKALMTVLWLGRDELTYCLS